MLLKFFAIFTGKHLCYEYCDILKNSFFYRTPLVAASVTADIYLRKIWKYFPCFLIVVERNFHWKENKLRKLKLFPVSPSSYFNFFENCKDALADFYAFFISNTFISHTRLKLAKNQANAKLYPEAELMFECYSYSSSTLSSKNNRTYPKKQRLFSLDHTINHNENEHENEKQITLIRHKWT